MLATEITLQPVRRYGVDAAVLYSDIVVPAHAVGFGIDVAPGTGPVAEQPFRSPADLARLRPLEPELDTPYVHRDRRQMVVRELPADVPLLGFAGAPFTVGQLPRRGPAEPHVRHTKRLMHTEPDLWHSS
jgi:uroporphyrinogen decarboxylase